MRKIGASGMPPNDESNRVLGTIKQTLFVLQAAVAAVLRANLPEDALYVLPGNSSDQKAMAEKYAAGPVAVIAYKAVGGQMMSPDMFMRGLLLDLVVAAIIAYLTVAGLPFALPVRQPYWLGVGTVHEPEQLELDEPVAAL